MDQALRDQVAQQVKEAYERGHRDGFEQCKRKVIEAVERKAQKTPPCSAHGIEADTALELVQVTAAQENDNG